MIEICLYEALVRPLIDEAALVWGPYLIKDIESIEKVQRKASRLAKSRKAETRIKKTVSVSKLENFRETKTIFYLSPNVTK